MGMNICSSNSYMIQFPILNMSNVLKSKASISNGRMDCKIKNINLPVDTPEGLGMLEPNTVTNLRLHSI